MTQPPPPGYPPQQPPAGQAPDNYLVWSILVTLFCCLPFGIVAIARFAGRTSVSGAVSVAVVGAPLTSVIVSVLVAPVTIDAGANATLTLGGAK